MRKITFFFQIIFLFSILQIGAQQLQVTHFSKDTKDLTARLGSKGKQNSNNEWCGLIRVRYAGDNMEFESNNIHEVEHLTGEYMVWMNPRATKLTIRVQGPAWRRPPQQNG